MLLIRTFFQTSQKLLFILGLGYLLMKDNRLNFTDNFLGRN
ncbi:hypothetical protein LEP1GSC050_0083 [Leptospira phage vB_LbrZ_5399-LE1]|nr:hypothetical protein LEP1GSC050_0083 [Leptospira phage vB_LbrZ_5399-LE1]AGS80789.1 hypothetical protein LEP1GSC047_0889 [Leptospira phage vB_LinZ_10-LE1]